MKRRFVLSVVGALVAIASPALFGCEQCLHKGQFDPAGNYLTENKCWSGYSTGYASCIPKETGEGCTTEVDSVCTGGSGGMVENPVPLRELPRNAGAVDCPTDLSGRCSREALSEARSAD